MRRMPDCPAVNFAQLSDLPTPSEVTTPAPVTAMTGRPALSRVGALAMTLSPSIDPLDQRQPFAPPIADAGDDDLGQRSRTFAHVPSARRGEQLAMLERRASDAQISNELGIDRMPDIGSGIADGKPNFLEH